MLTRPQIERAHLVFDLLIGRAHAELLFELLEFRGFQGTSPNVRIPKMISLLRQRAKGKIGLKELGQSFTLVESDDLRILYMGYAVKPSR